MKVKEIKAGGYYRMPDDKTKWTYFMLYDGVAMFTLDTFPTGEAAKQALREKVYQERKRHGLLLTM